MPAEQNKAVVRRFITEVITGGTWPSPGSWWRPTT